LVLLLYYLLAGNIIEARIHTQFFPFFCVFKVNRKENNQEKRRVNQ